MIILNLESLQDSYFYSKQSKGLGFFAELLIALRLNPRSFKFGLNQSNAGYYGSQTLPSLLKRLKEFKREE